MTIVDKIRLLANQRDMSIPDLEVALGLGNGTISRWKQSSPNTDKLTKVADYFNVSTDYLLGRKETDLEMAYFSFAKEAQDNGIDPDDIRATLDLLKKYKK